MTIIVFELIELFSNKNFDSLNCSSSKLSFDNDKKINLTIIKKFEIIEKIIKIFDDKIFVKTLNTKNFFEK